MKNIQQFFHARLLVVVFFLVACGPAPAPVDSVAAAAHYQNPALLERAWALPVASTYRSRFEYQINGAFCGPAAAVNLFHSLDLHQFTQNNVFDRAETGYWKARLLGMNLDELAGLIRDNAALEVTVLRGLTLEEFRGQMRRANDPALRYLINFNRRPLFGVSIGHHSPIGGYLMDLDLVFVLDVLDDYKPYLVSVPRLYEAMDTVDSETGKKRGLLAIGAAVPAAPSP